MPVSLLQSPSTPYNNVVVAEAMKSDQRRRIVNWLELCIVNADLLA